MSSIAKANISLSKKDLTKSRIPLVSSRNIAFYHKATVGSLSIDLLALSMPSEMPTMVQATADEISGARLLINKKNLSLVSSANGPLIQGMDYVVTSSTTIQLIGPYEASGAEVDEIFVGTINSAPVSDIVVASARSVDKTYTLAVGQTTLNLGREYEVGMNPNDDIGSIKVFVNGVLAHRGADYAEVDSGSGYGTTISFFAAPVSIPYQVAVDFGVMSISDNDAIGTIESLSGAVIKIAADLADVAGTNITDYLTANPSEVERRAFGDTVLSMLSKSFYIQNFQTSGFSGAGTKGSNNALRYASVLSSVTSEGSGLYAITDDATNGTRITILKKCKITISTSNGGPTINRGYGINKNGSVMINGVGVVTTSADRGACSITTVGNVNDFFDVRSTESGFTGGELIVFVEEIGNTPLAGI